MARSLDDLPSLGWVDRPSPVTTHPELAARAGLEWFGVKRDDRLGVIGGGSKVRKLDHVLAAAPLAGAPIWGAVGALGSGQLLACALAAARLGCRLEAHLFWQEPLEEIVANLSRTASGPVDLVWHQTELGMAATPPIALGFLGARTLVWRGVAWIPPGATCPAGMVGMVRAGLELAAQVRAGELPEPDRLYVALGSGGTAAGLAVGLAMAGLRTVVHAVAVVGGPLATRRRIDRLVGRLVDHLVAAGVEAGRNPAAYVVEKGAIGGGYGRPTAAGAAACEALATVGVTLERTYTGKAMGALLAGAAREGARTALFWNTAHGPLPPPDPDWESRLPASLARRLDPADRLRRRRRRRFLALAATGLGGLAFYRLTGPGGPEGWRGAHLSGAQAAVVLAAAEVLLPPAPDPAAARAVVEGVDRYVAALPPAVRDEVDLLLLAVEQATWLGLHLFRFTRLGPADRVDYIEGLRAAGGLRRQVYRGLRDLCMIGHYQQPLSWKAIDYGGPMTRAAPRPMAARYATLVAAAGVVPRGLVR